MHPIFKNSIKTFLISQPKCSLCNINLKSNYAINILYCNSKKCSLNKNSFIISFAKLELITLSFKLENDIYSIMDDKIYTSEGIFNIYDFDMSLPLNISKILDKINTILIFK